MTTILSALNPSLLLVLLAIATSLYCLRKSPKAMKRLAAWLMTVSELDEEYAVEKPMRLRKWQAEFGVTEGPTLVQSEEEA